MTEPEALALTAGERVPNSTFPVLVYRQAGAADATRMLGLFAQNGWSNGWRNGIYPFHHFHATAHEVLGIAAGRVTVRLGGETGVDVGLSAGDVAVLPAGTGHMRLWATGDLDVVGAYPGGCAWDLVRADEVTPERLAQARQAVARVPLPRHDPVYGHDGPLMRMWLAQSSPDQSRAARSGAHARL